MNRTTALQTHLADALRFRSPNFPHGTPKSQKGASALEYIVLAAAIIGIVTLLTTQTDVGTTFTTAFKGLFDSASTAASGG